MTVVYICDKHGCDSIDCRRFFDYACKHTSNAEHAKNGICEDPWNHPERFEKLGEDEYWEREPNG